MAYLAVDKDGGEAIYNHKPFRGINKVKPVTEMWFLPKIGSHYIRLPKGSIKKTYR